MRNFFRILRIRLDEGMGLGRLRHTTSQTEKIGIALYQAIRVLIFGGIMLAVYWLYQRLAASGLVTVVPTVSYFLASTFSVLVTIISINEMLTGNEDSEYLLSLPILPVVHATVMLLLLYVKCLGVTLLFEVPAASVYQSNLSVSGFMGRWLVGAVLSCLPLGGIACLAGTVIALVLAHSPKKEQIKTGIAIGMIALGAAVVFMIGNQIGGTLQAVSSDAQQVSKEIITMFVKNFRFTRMYQFAVVEQSTGYMALFVFSSIIWYIGFCFAFVVGYRVMIISFRCPADYKTYEFAEQKQKQLPRALFQKEWQQMVRSKTYMTRSMMGIIVGTMLAITTVAYGAEVLLQVIPAWKVPILICFFVGMSNTTYCALSMEGRRHWIEESSPFQTRISYTSKVLVNLAFTIPFVWISGVLLWIAIKPQVWMGVLSLLVPMGYAITNAYWGIWVNHKFGNCHCESEEQAMHQGLSYVLGYLPGVIIPILLIIAL